MCCIQDSLLKLLDLYIATHETWSPLLWPNPVSPPLPPLSQLLVASQGTCKRVLSSSFLFQIRNQFNRPNFFTGLGSRRASLPGSNVIQTFNQKFSLSKNPNSLKSKINFQLQASQEGEGGVEPGQWDQLLLHLPLHVRLPFSCQGLDFGKRVQEQNMWSISHQNLLLID